MTIHLPGFTADLSISAKTRPYRTTSWHSPGPSFSVLPQARIGFGGLGGFGGFGGLGIEPRAPECSECQWTCTEVSCGPGCRREECRDVCTSVPCAIG